MTDCASQKCAKVPRAREKILQELIDRLGADPKVSPLAEVARERELIKADANGKMTEDGVRGAAETLLLKLSQLGNLDIFAEILHLEKSGSENCEHKAYILEFELAQALVPHTKSTKQARLLPTSRRITGGMTARRQLFPQELLPIDWLDMGTPTNLIQFVLESWRLYNVPLDSIMISNGKRARDDGDSTKDLGRPDSKMTRMPLQEEGSIH